MATTTDRDDAGGIAAAAGQGALERPARRPAPRGPAGPFQAPEGPLRARVARAARVLP
ncbi:hypothetical protein [Streptomyces sp. NPDC057616]|uniref:hypothetical protein n=1 Tax=Streptomyces sp. NPDC057616 TaxID=3346183 RepID=UPI0036894672